MKPGSTWRLLRTWDAPPGFNMALDEALLLSAETRATLRLYTWAPDALSLGYFQRFDEVTAALSELPTIVRRLTGGGAIHHLRELTFSIAAPADHPVYRGTVAESYERVHGAVAQALARFGADATPRAANPLDSDNPSSPMCFHTSTPLDLAWGGRKGVGSAQRRTRGRVLHHGSIKLGSTHLEGDVATLDDVGPQEAGAALVEAFEACLGATFEPETPTEDDLLHARARETHFTSDAFVRKR